MGSDFGLVLRFWFTLFMIGVAAFPLARLLFRKWYDQGYMFAKALGLALVTYIVYFSGTLYIAPFTNTTIMAAMAIVFLAGFVVQVGRISLEQSGSEVRLVMKYRGEGEEGKPVNPEQAANRLLLKFLVIAGEELLFFACLFLWSWVKGHEASIRGLEKFMDYGFARTALNSSYFPVADMWYAGFPINYYYFGHICMALLTKLSSIDLAYVFNLMLAGVFAFTFTMSFSIGFQLLLAYFKLHLPLQTEKSNSNRTDPSQTRWWIISLLGALLLAYLVTLGGNMQTLYAFTKGYTGEDVKPFWELLWSPSEFFSKFNEGKERYWYANATRFIPFTIHEFPSYSFVVSDLHGHVLSLPFVLLALAFLLRLFWDIRKPLSLRFVGACVFYGLLLSILLMTNALDGPIYLGLFFVLFGLKALLGIRRGEGWLHYVTIGVGVFFTWIIGSLPFLYHFRSFVSGLAVNCPPPFLAGTDEVPRKIGLFLLEGGNKCQHSPFWMWWILWGFFIFCGVWLLAIKWKEYKADESPDVQIPHTANQRRPQAVQQKPSPLARFFERPYEIVLMVFFFYSLGLIIFPEYFYFKDIYPAHFRSNTMFKLGYQAFIMFGILTGYTIVTTLVRKVRTLPGGIKYKKLFFGLLAPQIFLVVIYPYFSVRSYFGGLREYQGLYGLSWMEKELPDDYKALSWLEKEIGKVKESGGEDSKVSEKATYFPLPVIAEADGDSYTDYNHFSAFAGMPSVVGWAVHEWLWRGTYDVVAPRREDTRLIYESTDKNQILSILEKYRVRYILVGKIEREKYKSLNEPMIKSLGRPVFQSGMTTIYEVAQVSFVR